jgi:hypothetical protein
VLGGELRADLVALLRDFGANFLRYHGMLVTGVVLLHERDRPECPQFLQEGVFGARRQAFRNVILGAIERGEARADADVDTCVSLLVGYWHGSYYHLLVAPTADGRRVVAGRLPLRRAGGKISLADTRSQVYTFERARAPGEVELARPAVSARRESLPCRPAYGGRSKRGLAPEQHRGVAAQIPGGRGRSASFIDRGKPPRPRQQGDRARPGHQRENGEDPRAQHPGQARRPEPHSGGAVRRAGGSSLRRSAWSGKHAPLNAPPNRSSVLQSPAGGVLPRRVQVLHLLRRRFPPMKPTAVPVHRRAASSRGGCQAQGVL